MKNIVELVAPDPSVGLGGVDMLCDIAAEMDVDKLEPLADTEHGLFCATKRERMVNCRISSSVSMLREPWSFCPKKAGVISPPPGRRRWVAVSV